MPTKPKKEPFTKRAEKRKRDTVNPEVVNVIPTDKREFYDAITKINRGMVVRNFDNILNSAFSRAKHLNQLEEKLMDPVRLGRASTDELVSIYRAITARYGTELSAVTRLTDVSLKDAFVRSFMGLSGESDEPEGGPEKVVPEVTNRQKQALFLLNEAASKRVSELGVDADIFKENTKDDDGIGET